MKNARALCVGAGGLGSSALLYLAGAGIGMLGIVDGDKVAPSNLHRQILYSSQDIGKDKTKAAKKRLQSLNPNVNITIHPEKLKVENALKIMNGYDIVIDGTDNFTAKYLINDACFILKKPVVFASVYQFGGYCSVFLPEGPCYRCLYPNPPKNFIPNCAQAGVLGHIITHKYPLTLPAQ